MVSLWKPPLLARRRWSKREEIEHELRLLIPERRTAASFFRFCDSCGGFLESEHPAIRQSVQGPPPLPGSEWSWHESTMNKPIEWTEQERLACSRRLLTYFGCIVELLGDGKGVSRGTVTFIRVGEILLLLTAKHVASALIGRQCRVLVLPMETSGALVAAVQVPVMIDFVPELVAASPETVLDVAFLKCPAELALLPISSFDLDDAVVHVDARRASLPDEHNSPYLKADFVCGYPNFAALESEPERIQLMGGSSRQIELHTLDPSVPGMRPAQLTATLFLDGKPSGRPIEDLFQSRLEHQENPFGGYSGGPIVNVESPQPPRIHLLGSVKQGDRMFTEGRVIGTPIVVDASRELLHSVMR